MSRLLVFFVVSVIALPGCGGCARTSNDEIAAEGKIAAVEPPNIAKTDYPWWRGPNSNARTIDDASYPTTWSHTKNVVWKTAVPGHGLSSPTVVGNRIFLTTADKESGVQSVLCYNRESGKLAWRTDVNSGKLGDAGHQDNSHASATVAADGTRVFALFKSGKTISVYALDLKGKQLWKTEVGRYQSAWGLGTSPAIVREFVIVSADSGTSDTGFIAAINRKTGNIRWRKHRPAYDSYASPVIATINGKEQILLCGGKQVISYDPATGEENWAIDAGTKTMCGTVTWEGNMVFASGGHPKRETVGIRVTDGKPEVVWRNSRKFYVPSILAHDGCLYGNDYNDVLYCLDAATGQVNWRKRPDGSSYGSPVFAGGHIYIPLRKGKVIVIKPIASKYDEVAVNSLGDEMDTTPTACGGRLYLRVVERTGDGKRGWLYCIGEK